MEYFLYSCHCNIRFPYRIRKVLRDILINILGYEGKKVMR